MQHLDQITESEVIVELTDESLDLVAAGKSGTIDPNG